MNVVKLPLGELRKPERNVRLHSNKQISEFKRSVEMFGQIRPIVVDESHTILAGNGLFDALKALGRTDADCYVVTGLTEAEKKKLMLADNRIFNLGIDDVQAFDDIIAELEGDVDIPGYDPELLRTITADVDIADDIICGYGTVGDETRVTMQQASADYARREESFAQEAQRIDVQMGRKPVATESNGTFATGNMEVSHEQAPVPEPVGAQKRQFLVCPKCGERIWL